MTNHVNSIIRAMEIIEALNESPYEWSCMEISRKVQLASSTVHRILSTLEHKGYIYQNRYNSKYKLGFKFLDLNDSFNKKQDMKDFSQYYIENLSKVTRETIGLGVLDKSEIIHLARVESPEVLKANLEHFRLPAPSSAIGKYLLAFLPEEEIDRILPATLPKRTNNTITSLIEFKKELKKIRIQNYAMDNEEGFNWVRCIATGITDGNNNIIAAISIIAPSNRFPDSKIPLYRELLMSTANEISKAIKFFPHTKLS